MIFPALASHAEVLVKVLEKYVEKKEIVEGKDIAKKFGMDSMGSCTFGFEINTLAGKNEEFQDLVRNVVAITWKTIVEFTIDRRILKFFRIRISNPKIQNYIVSTVNETLEYRKKNNIKRNDIFEYMHQMTDYEISDEELIKNRKLSKVQMMIQLLTFFVGSFETSSSTTAFTLLELSQNLNVQDKLRENIRECLKKHGQLTYDAIMEMDYLDWTICGKKYFSLIICNVIYSFLGKYYCSYMLIEIM